VSFVVTEAESLISLVAKHAPVLRAQAHVVVLNLGAMLQLQKVLAANRLKDVKQFVNY
jgi:hypothetical protein